MISDAIKIAILKQAPRLSHIELIELVVKECELQGGELYAIAKVADWGVEGPKFKGLTNDWPSIGTILYARREKEKNT